MAIPPKTLPRPTDAELEILTVLWSRGPTTVREVHETIVARKPTQYTTVLKTLQIMAERPDGSMDVEGCTTLSQVLLDFIEKEDPIEGDYEIEVSSPGIDRPLTRLGDFSRWKGHEAKIELTAPQDGRKRFRGKLEGLDGQDVVVAMAEGEAKIPFRAILEAKLVLINKLIEEDLKAKKTANKQEKV